MWITNSKTNPQEVHMCIQLLQWSSSLVKQNNDVFNLNVVHKETM